jgi:hypothetical protein
MKEIEDSPQNGGMKSEVRSQKSEYRIPHRIGFCGAAIFRNPANSQGISMVIYTNSGLAIPLLKEAADNAWPLLSPGYRAFPQGR